MQSSTFLGYGPTGHPMFENIRTDVGEATYQLKYKGDWAQAKPLANLILTTIYPMLPKIGFIVPMPASTKRPRQPVTEVATELGILASTPVFDDLLLKGPNVNGVHLKDLHGKEAKIAAIGSSFSLNEAAIENEGAWNVLVVDDLFDTGASMEMACSALRNYRKANRIYVVALTRKR